MLCSGKLLYVIAYVFVFFYVPSMRTARSVCSMFYTYCFQYVLGGEVCHKQEVWCLMIEAYTHPLPNLGRLDGESYCFEDCKNACRTREKPAWRVVSVCAWILRRDCEWLDEMVSSGSWSWAVVEDGRVGGGWLLW